MKKNEELRQICFLVGLLRSTPPSGITTNAVNQAFNLAQLRKGVSEGLRFCHYYFH